MFPCIGHGVFATCVWQLGLAAILAACRRLVAALVRAPSLQHIEEQAFAYQKQGWRQIVRERYVEWKNLTYRLTGKRPAPDVARFVRRRIREEAWEELTELSAQRH